MGLGRSLERITKHARMGHLGGSTKWKQVASTYVGKSSKAGSHFPLTHSTFRKPLNNPGPTNIYRPCGSPLVFHKDGTLQPLESAAQVYVFFDAFCNARHSRAQPKRSCKAYSQLFNSLYFAMLSAMEGIPEHSNRRPANPTVVQF